MKMNDEQKQPMTLDPQLSTLESRPSTHYPRWIFIWWLFLGCFNLFWLIRDKRPPTWDPFSHLLSSLKYYHAIQDIFSSTIGFGDAVSLVLNVDDFYPPLAPFLASFFSFVVPPDPDIATWILSFIFTGILLIAMYRLGTLLYSPEIGFYACIAITSFRYFSNQSRMFMLDLPLTAMTTLGIYALFKTDSFIRTKASLLFGLISALAMLTKWTYLFFIIVPIICVFWQVIKAKDRLIRIIHFAISCTACTIICLPWYLTHLLNLLSSFTKYGYQIGTREGDPYVFSFKSFTYYFLSLPSLTLIPWFILFITGLIFYFRKELTKYPIIGLWLLGGYAIFTLMRNKEIQFIMPLLPAIALLATSWLKELNVKQIIKTCGIVALAVYSLGNSFYFEPPMIQDWPMEEAFEFVRTEKSFHPVSRLRVVPDYPYLERNAFKYYSELERFPLEVTTWGGHFPSSTDFIITKTGDQGVRDEARETMELIGQESSHFYNIFKTKWQRPLPDGSICSIYVRDITPAEIPPLRVIRQFKNIIRENGAPYVSNPERAVIDVEPFSDLDTMAGRFQNATISMASAFLGPFSDTDIYLPVHNLKIELNDLTINPWKLFNTDTIEIISLMEMRPQFQISEQEFNAFLAQINSKLYSSVTFQNNTAQVHACRKNTHLCADIIMKPVIIDQENIAIEFSSFKILGIPLPAFLPQVLTHSNQPLLRHLPFRLHLDSIDLNNGICTIN